MKGRGLILATMLAILSALTGGCGGWNPLGIPTHFEIETTSELGSNTLSRIDDLNDVLERGVEIGPETRGTIEELNDTIRDGIRFGFTEDSLARVDRLLDIVEQGVGIKVGLDEETNDTVNELIDTIDEAPDQWEGTALEIIDALEGSTSAVAGQMADEVRSLMTDARLNTQQLSASMGAEFRCNVDFLGARANDTLDQFIGRTIVGRLRAIVSGKPEEETTPIPWVCGIVPDMLDLVQIEDRLVSDQAVVRISGYNYVEANLPIAYLVDGDGRPIDSTALVPFITSPYQITLNVDRIDFRTIPARSRIAFEWPLLGQSYNVGFVFPDEENPPTEVVEAELTITAPSVDVRRGPGASYNVFGRLEVGAIALVTGRNGDSSLWRIDYEGEDGGVPATAGTRNEIEVPSVALPLPPPVADFDTDPRSGGDAPLEVQFIDRSSGSPSHYEWDFGGGLPSAEKNPKHVFETAGTYRVLLTVENDLGSSSMTQTIVVTQPVATEPPVVTESPEEPEPVSPFTNGSILLRTFPALGDRVHYNTGISTSTYECGVVGMSASGGDIDASGVVDIISAFMSEEGGTWAINADFQNQVYKENWDIFVMCLNRSASDGYEFYRRVRVQPDDSDTVSLKGLHIPEGWHCGVAGISARSGDINEDGTGAYIIEAFVQQDAGGEWQLTANFRSEGEAEEYWDVDVLCVEDDPDVFLHQTFYARDGGTPFNTNISYANYICAVDGFAARNGDVNESVYAFSSPIIQAYAYLVSVSPNWTVIADFRNDGAQERWDIQLLCVRRPIGTW